MVSMKKSYTEWSSKLTTILKKRFPYLENITAEKENSEMSYMRPRSKAFNS